MGFRIHNNRGCQLAMNYRGNNRVLNKEGYNWDCSGTVKSENNPRAYVFQRPFLRGLFFEALIFGGAYLRREICRFRFALLCI